MQILTFFSPFMARRMASAQSAPAKTTAQNRETKTKNQPPLTERAGRSRVEQFLTVSHREGGGSSSVLGLDDLVTTELDALDESGEGLSTLLDELLALGDLRQEGDDRGSRVTSDDGNVRVGRVGASELRNESRGTDNVEGRDTEEAVARNRRERVNFPPEDIELKRCETNRLGS